MPPVAVARAARARGAYNGAIAHRPLPLPHGAPQEIPMPVLERIRDEVESHPVVLFMKGTPQFPMCGFSSRTIEALKAAGATSIRTINVLQEPEIRANLPRFSNWPTFPQLFIHGELIGGCDITLELHESGELARMIAEVQKA
jgi:monothiol glutaredoxin